MKSNNWTPVCVNGGSLGRCASMCVCHRVGHSGGHMSGHLSF